MTKRTSSFAKLTSPSRNLFPAHVLFKARDFLQLSPYDVLEPDENLYQVTLVFSQIQADVRDIASSLR